MWVDCFKYFKNCIEHFNEVRQRSKQGVQSIAFIRVRDYGDLDEDNNLGDGEK